MMDLHEHERLEDEVMSFVRKSEEGTMKAVRSWAKAVEKAVPGEWPTVHSVVADVFDFTDDLLRIQREFAHNMLKESRRMLRETARPTGRRTPTTRATPHRASTPHQVSTTRTTPKAPTTTRPRARRTATSRSASARRTAA